MSRRKKGSIPGAEAWADAVEDAPRADLPDEKHSKRARWKRRYVWAATVLFVPALVLNAVVIVNSMTSSAQEEDPSVLAAETSPLAIEARAMAEMEVERWLASSPSPLPGGLLLSWNYAEPVEALSPEEVDQSGEEVAWEQVLKHDLTVSAAGALYSVNVTTVVDPLAGVELVGSPSLLPYAPAASSGFTGYWPGAQAVATTEAIDQAVHQWARDFTGGDPSALRLRVGDPDGSRSYMPLVGVTLYSVEVVGATVQEHLLEEETGRPPANPEQVVARVELRVLWDGDAEADDSAQRNLQPISYDVLIDRADTASPQVVAWGGPGSGPGLQPYENAVVGRELTVNEALPQDEGEPAADETATPAGENEEEEAPTDG